MRYPGRALVAVVLALAVLVARPRPPAVHASEVWCWDDPAVLVDGVPIAINLGIRTHQLSAIDAIDITIEVPAGVTVRMLALERAHITPTVQFAPTGAENRVTVTVVLHAQDSFDYAVNLLNAGQAAIMPQTTTAFANQVYVGSIPLRDE